MQSATTYLKQLAVNHPKLVLLAKTLLVFTAFFIACFCNLDPDFGWHLQSGNYFLAHGIPTHDVFTYTARNFHWIDHEWGNDVLFSYLYRLHGYLLLALVFAGLWTLSLMIAAWRVRSVFLLVAVAAMLPYIAIRPTVWDVLGLSIVLQILRTKRSSRALLWLPLMFILWANLHGGFVLGLVVLLYFAILRKSRPLFAMLALCTAITFINPYGPQLYVEIFRTLTDLSLHSQTEGMAVFAFQHSAWPLIILWGAGFWVFARKGLLSWIGLAPIFLVASISAVRYFPLFVVVAIPQLDHYYDEVKRLLPKPLPRPAKNVLLVMAAVVTGAAICFIYTYVQPTADREATYPEAAVAYLQTHTCNGNLFNDFDYGGYLIWKLPQYRVFIDGRMPSWRDPQGVKYIDTYFKILSNPPTRIANFKQYNITCALVRNASDTTSFINGLEAEGWRSPVTANGSILLMAPHGN